MFDLIPKRIASILAATVMATSNVMPMASVVSDKNETDLTYQIIELYPDEEADEKFVTLDGLMPEGAEATAVDVSEEHEGIAAYDITIMDGWRAYQPGEENPIKVEITDPVITESIELWHIHDNGTREQLFDFTAEDGKVSFFATGFSVYEIVEGAFSDMALNYPIVPVTGEIPDNVITVQEAPALVNYTYSKVTPTFDTISGTATKLSSLSDFQNYIANNQNGFYISTQRKGYYLRNGQETGIKEGRTGIAVTNAFKTNDENNDINNAFEAGAHRFYFEVVDSENDLYYIYTLADDGSKKYVGHEQNQKKLYLTNDDNNTSTNLTNPTQWKVSYKNNIINNGKTYNYFFFKENGTNYCWSETDGNNALPGVTSWSYKDAEIAATSINEGLMFSLWSYEPDNLTEEPYHISGTPYGLVTSDSGNALMAGQYTGTPNRLGNLSPVSTENNVFSYQYGISGWTFEWIPGTLEYKIKATAEDGAVPKYLHMDKNGLSLTDGASASHFMVMPDKNAGKIKLIVTSMNSAVAKNSSTNFQKNTIKNASEFYLVNMTTSSADALALCGEPYGLISSTSNSAMMASLNGTTKLNGQAVTPSTNDQGKTVYRSTNEITSWTFSHIDANRYTISTTVSGETKYVNLINNALTLSNTPYVLTVLSNNEGQIKICNTTDQKAIKGAFQSDSIANGCWFDLAVLPEPLTEDPLNLSGKYGLVTQNNDASKGYAMMTSGTALKAAELKAETDKYTGSIVVSSYQFHWQSGLNYTIETDDGRYLIMDGNGLRVSATETPTVFTVEPGTGQYANKVKIYAGDKAINRNSTTDYRSGNMTDSNNNYFSLVRNNLIDPYKLNNKSYALMYYSGGNTGNGFYTNSSGTLASAELLSWVIRTKNADDTVTTRTYYVADDVDLHTWTFHSIAEENYSLSTTVGSATKYLHIDETTGTLSLSDTAQPIKVTLDQNKNIMLSVGNWAVTFQAGSGDDPDSFVGAPKSGTNQYMKLVDAAALQNNDYVTYSAKKVSVSAGTNGTKDGDEVLVYTRIWKEKPDGSDGHYEFYAVGGDGALYPCYERGDNIMWVGGRIDTLLWKFTEYTYDDGTPNYYYELYNPYTQMYIAPKRATLNTEEDQVIRDSKIGINLPGRKSGEYYTDILAWDDPSYSYSGLGTQIINAESSTTIPTNRHNAASFYFAKIIDPSTTLTVVDTIDNNDYGIKMKMVDWKQETIIGQKGKTQSVFLGNYQGGTGNGLQKGLLSTDLIYSNPNDPSTGYPTTAEENSTIVGYEKGKSLKELYDNADGIYGAQTVNHLFIKSTYEATGYFEFDSCQNTATLIPNGGALQSDFTVYKELATDNNSGTTHRHGQFFPYDYILPGVYPTVEDNQQNTYNALNSELSPDDPRKYEKLHLLQYASSQGRPNCYNGMELTASFTQTPSGKDNWNHDIIFEFTGDDDFWLYVDGELIIDLGGIHSAVPGNVNFATGVVVVNNGTPTTLRDVFIANYKERNPEWTKAEIEAFLREKKFGEYPGVDENAPLEEKFEPIFDDYSKHAMRIFYMERGAGASNLHMRFNLSYVNPGSVILKKEISGTDDLDYDAVEYPIQILYRDTSENHDLHYLGDVTDSAQNQNIFITYQNSTKIVEHVQNYTPPGVTPVDPPDNTHTFKSVFFINPLNSAEIHFPEDTFQYQIVECGMNTDVYDWTKINGVTPVTPDQNNPDPTKPEKENCGDRVNYKSAWTTVEQQTNVTFNNNVNPDGLRTLTFRKKLFNDNYRKYSELSDAEKAQYPTKESWEEHCKLTVTEDPTMFAFRLYLSNGVTEDTLLAYMVKYRVLDPDGYYCRWDSAHQEFVPYTYNGSTIHGKTALDTLLEAIANNSELSNDAKKAAKEALLEPMTFESSMNGQISKIQAWYSVEVPNLPIGTKFMVEERDAESERPLGFDRVEYEREEGTYYVDPGDMPNTGTIHKLDSPNMSVSNQRGFEIQATKIWSDADFTKGHDDIYTALYVGDLGTDRKLTNLELVPGSVRKLTNGNGASRHFLPALKTGCTLDNYAVYEVTLTNPQEDTDGNITYDTITPLGDGAPTTIGAIPSNPENAPRDTYSYTVNYEYGQPIYNVANVNNARSDTISNDRGGGVVIRLFDMALNAQEKHDPLADGLFTLKQGDTVIGTYRSNGNGKITIMYDFTYNTEYTLTQTAAPEHYIGLPEPLTFKLQKSGTQTEPVYSVTFGEDLPEKWRDADTQAGDEIVAYINVYNTKFTLKAVKVAKPKKTDEGEDEPEPQKLAGAVFALYRALKGVGGYVKDYQPMQGFETLTTDENGVIPKINQDDLEAGRYFLCEVTPPNGYKVLEHDIAFQIADHDIELFSSDSNVELTKSTENNRYNCKITIQNVPDIQNYYFDIEKNIFVDKNIHDSDTEQKFVFKVERFKDTTTDFSTTPEEVFYVTLNCDQELQYTADNDIKFKTSGAKYNYEFYHTADEDAYPYSVFSESGENIHISKTYHKNGETVTYSYLAAIWNGRKTIHVQKEGVYRISEVKSWSNTDYDFWTGSNVYKGYGDGSQDGVDKIATGFKDSKSTDDNMLPSGDKNCVYIDVTKLKADQFEDETATIVSKTVYRPTASFTNSETEFAYLSSQAWAENIIRFN